MFHWAGAPGGVSEPEVKRRFAEFFATAPARFAWYDASSPESDQRNRVVEAISRIPLGELESSRIYSEVLVPLRLEQHEQLRVLVCDGPELLGWFGAFISAGADARQRKILRRLVPAVRERLSIEQRLREAPRLSAALEAALDHLGAPAFVLSERGNIRELNAAGRALVDGASGSDLTGSLQQAVTGPAGKLGFELIRLQDGGRPMGWLALARGRASNAPASLDRRMRTERHASRWRLSPRQTQVLELLASGASNLRIGSELGISERTVEDHVAAILTKAQVGTRAELIAALLE